MNEPRALIGDPDSPGIREALVYLAGLGVPKRDVQHIVITGGYREPTTITVTLVVRDRTEGETVRFEPGCLCPRNAAGRVGTDPRCPMHQPGAAGLAEVPTERTPICEIHGQVMIKGRDGYVCACTLGGDWDGEQLGGR